MKRQHLFFILILISFILTPFALVFLELNILTKYMVAIILVLVSAFIYAYLGISKLIVYGIYALFISIALIILPEYDIAFITVGMLLYLINPLANLEMWIKNKFNEELPPLKFYLRKSYAPYYEYREEMKNYYHKPQAIKLMNNELYVFLRRALYIFMTALGLYLFIRGLNELIKIFDSFNIHTFFANSYSILSVLILTMLLYKKGFKTTFRTGLYFLLPPLIYLVFLSNLGPFLKPFTGIILIVFSIVSIIFGVIAYYKRVVYESYSYIDIETQEEVFANALFEPVAYNESFNLTSTFTIKTNMNRFNKNLHRIITYANFHRFFIVAYTYRRRQVTIHAHFNFQDEHKITRFQTFISSLFEQGVTKETIVDTHKLNYEKKFFHNKEFIKARAIYLADLLKDLKIDTEVIISIVAYFEDPIELQLFTDYYQAFLIPELSDDVLTVRIDYSVSNIEELISNRVDDILLKLVLFNGNYVRLSMFS